MDRVWILAAVVAFSLAPPARAEEGTTAAEIVEKLQFHGFVSQGFLITTDNDYLARSERGSFEFSEAGINLTASLTDHLRAGIQLFARDLGPIGNYHAILDWYYLDYRFFDWLGVRAGRLKLPIGLYNDTSDIDAAHTVVLLPGSVYPQTNRDFLLAQTGFEVYGFRSFGDAGSLTYRLNLGTIFIPRENTTPGVTILDLSIPYVAGGRLLWETPLDGLRVGASVHALRLETDFAVPMVPDPVSAELDAIIWVASAEFLRGDLLVAAEYSRWHIDTESTNEMVVPSGESASERAYLMGSYRVNSWLQPGLYYSLLFPDVDDRSGRESQQHDVCATVRFDVNQYWLIKLEAHYMHGTAALSASFNELPLDQLQDDWGLFLAKTTAYF